MKDIKNMNLYEIDGIELEYPPLVGSVKNITPKNYGLVENLKQAKAKRTRSKTIKYVIRNKPKAVPEKYKPETIFEIPIFKIRIQGSKRIFKIKLLSRIEDRLSYQQQLAVLMKNQNRLRRSLDLHHPFRGSGGKVGILEVSVGGRSKRQFQFSIGKRIWYTLVPHTDKDLIYQLSLLQPNRFYSFNVIQSVNQLNDFPISTVLA